VRSVVDAPLGEAREQYNVTITGIGGALHLIADQPTLSVPVEQLAIAGTGPAAVEVSQVGDWAKSKLGQLTTTL
jgi:hypothetical protein